MNGFNQNPDLTPPHDLDLNGINYNNNPEEIEHSAKPGKILIYGGIIVAVLSLIIASKFLFQGSPPTTNVPSEGATLTQPNSTTR